MGNSKDDQLRLLLMEPEDQRILTDLVLNFRFRFFIGSEQLRFFLVINLKIITVYRTIKPCLDHFRDVGASISNITKTASISANSRTVFKQSMY